MDTMEEGFDKVIYTRANALADGVLVDLSSLAREAGFKIPLAVTDDVWDVVSPERMPSCQDWQGRAWDLLTILRLAINRTAPGATSIEFAPLFVMESGHAPKPVQMWALCSPGDNAEPVMTIMLPKTGYYADKTTSLFGSA